MRDDGLVMRYMSSIVVVVVEPNDLWLADLSYLVFEEKGGKPGLGHSSLVGTANRNLPSKA